jgi:hypothetical protein
LDQKLLRNLANIVSAARLLVAPDVIDHQLNPIHLALAQRGYWIQEHVLRIPDRFGFFSPSPPRLQAYEGSVFACVAIIHGLVFSWGLFALFCLYLSGMFTRTLVAAMIAMVLTSLGLFWVGACFDPRRLPGYDWSDWKTRKE